MKYSHSIFHRMRLHWDTTDIIAITANGVCPSYIYQWSMRCPCSNYHVPLSLFFLSYFFSFLILQMSNLDLWEKRDEKKIADTNVMLFLKAKGGGRQKSSFCLSVYIFFSRRMSTWRWHTHTQFEQVTWGRIW